ncbi:MAG: hypothetical protein [Cressdnaviricota sp.]|nr:MAG: hypothetical protein [Cressdnaviricota sp.]
MWCARFTSLFLTRQLFNGTTLHKKINILFCVIVKGKDPVLRWRNLYSITRFPFGTIGTISTHYTIAKEKKLFVHFTFALKKRHYELKKRHYAHKKRHYQLKKKHCEILRAPF